MISFKPTFLLQPFVVLFLFITMVSPVVVRADYIVMKSQSLEDYQQAKCLDGTPAMYYYHTTQSNNNNNKWYIELQGGGWCTNERNCYDRSKTQFGSSKQWRSTTLRKTPFFNDDPIVNPLTHDWNKVYIRYCDGFGFIGNQSQPIIVSGDGGNDTPLYSRGYEILHSTITDLINNKNLGKASDVLVGGCSAGGLTALWTCDTWANRIHEYNPKTQVKCAPDSGFFVNYKLENSNRPTYLDLMQDGYKFHQPTLPSTSKCTTQDPSHCLLAENVVPYIQAPIFVMQPLYDSWAKGAIELSRDNHAEVNAYGKLVTNTIRNTVLSSGGTTNNGIFLDACTRHGCNGYEVYIDGINKMNALKMWYEAEEESFDHGPDIHIQDEQYPCLDCCDGTPKPTLPTTSPPTKSSQVPSSAPTSMMSMTPSAAPTALFKELHDEEGCHCHCHDPILLPSEDDDYLLMMGNTPSPTDGSPKTVTYTNALRHAEIPSSSSTAKSHRFGISITALFVGIMTALVCF